MNVHVSANKRYNFILSTTFVLILNVHSHTKEWNGLIGEIEKAHEFKTHKDHKLLKIFPSDYHFNYRFKKKKNFFVFLVFSAAPICHLLLHFVSPRVLSYDFTFHLGLWVSFLYQCMQYLQTHDDHYAKVGTLLKIFKMSSLKFVLEKKIIMLVLITWSECLFFLLFSEILLFFSPICSSVQKQCR